MINIDEIVDGIGHAVYFGDHLEGLRVDVLPPPYGDTEHIGITVSVSAADLTPEQAIDLSKLLRVAALFAIRTREGNSGDDLDDMHIIPMTR